MLTQVIAVKGTVIVKLLANLGSTPDCETIPTPRRSGLTLAPTLAGSVYRQTAD
jgi:hypothetical protein